MEDVKRILIIDKHADYRELLIKKLGRFYKKATVDQIDPPTQKMPDEGFPWHYYDLLIMEYQIGTKDTGLDWFRQFDVHILPATILLTAMGNEEIAVNAIKIGIDNYLVKERFEDEKFVNAIEESIASKKDKRKKVLALSNQSKVFNKFNFFSRLEGIKKNRKTDDKLVIVSPVLFHRVGNEKGIIHQDNFIKNIANSIFDYFESEKLFSNIIIYRDEYIAVIVDTETLKEHIDKLCKKLDKETTTITSKKYSCKIKAGALIPGVMEDSELKVSDSELLTSVMKLCDLAKADEGKDVYFYGDVDIQDKLTTETEVNETIQNFDIESAIADGRITSNYQPWVFVRSGETEETKSIYDVRIDLIDQNGAQISKPDLIKLFDNLFVKRVVDKWVLKHCISQLSALIEKKSKKKKHHIKLSIKLTNGSISDPDFYDWLKDLLNDAKLPKGSILIELDANHLINDSKHCVAFMNAIGPKFGIKFILSGVDQVDTYYQIREIQKFDYVKLNIKNLSFGQPRTPTQKLVDTIKDDGGMVVAISVTDAESLALATEFNIDFVHGYLISKPNIDVITDSDGELYSVVM